jgi:hypothetical protein
MDEAYRRWNKERIEKIYNKAIDATNRNDIDEAEKNNTEMNRQLET